MSSIKLVLVIPFFLFIFCAEHLSYYETIQSKNAKENANDYGNIEKSLMDNWLSDTGYYKLSNFYMNSTERVWGVIYGEAFCLLSKDTLLKDEIKKRLFSTYDLAITYKSENSVSVSLTKTIGVISAKVPFETNYELSFALGLGDYSDLKPLTIRKLNEVLTRSDSIWNTKNLPKTSIIRYHEDLISSSLYEAYNYWLFQNANLNEFSIWYSSNKLKYDELLEWLNKNPFKPDKPDFNRLYLQQE